MANISTKSNLIKANLNTDKLIPGQWQIIENIMDHYAKQVAIDFGKWLAGGIMPNAMEDLYKEYLLSSNPTNSTSPIKQ